MLIVDSLISVHNTVELVIEGTIDLKEFSTDVPAEIVLEVCLVNDIMLNIFEVLHSWDSTGVNLEVGGIVVRINIIID